jgi:hypothetical protein
MKCFLLLFCLWFSTTASAQRNYNDRIMEKANYFKTLLAKADTIGAWDNWDTVALLNDSIAAAATGLLSSPQIVRYNLDSLLPGIVRSKDKRLWIFSWFENTGGSFQSFLSVVHYRTASGKPRAVYLKDFGLGDHGFSTEGGPAGSIYQLPHPSRNIYLCTFTVRGCGSCCAEVASVIELAKEGINPNYPAFQKIEKTALNKPVQQFSTTYVLDSRCGSITRFTYNPKTAAISYAYETDDNTPVTQETAAQVRGTLRWNGKFFRESAVVK